MDKFGKPVAAGDRVAVPFPGEDALVVCTVNSMTGGGRFCTVEVRGDPTADAASRLTADVIRVEQDATTGEWRPIP